MVLACPGRLVAAISSCRASPAPSGPVPPWRPVVDPRRTESGEGRRCRHGARGAAVVDAARRRGRRRAAGRPARSRCDEGARRVHHNRGLHAVRRMTPRRGGMPLPRECSADLRHGLTAWLFARLPPRTGEVSGFRDRGRSGPVHRWRTRRDRDNRRLAASAWRPTNPPRSPPPAGSGAALRRRFPGPKVIRSAGRQFQRWHHRPPAVQSSRGLLPAVAGIHSSLHSLPTFNAESIFLVLS